MALGFLFGCCCWIVCAKGFAALTRVQGLSSSAAPFQQCPGSGDSKEGSPNPRISLPPWDPSSPDGCWLILCSILCTFGNVLLRGILNTLDIYMII